MCNLFTVKRSDLQQGPALLQLQEVLHREKVVVHARNFSVTWATRCTWTANQREEVTRSPGEDKWKEALFLSCY